MSGAKLPTDAKTRKDAPIARGVLDYFPNALAAVAELSRIGNEQHNPGQPMHWAKEKSTDHADCIIRHLIDRGTVDTDGVRHTTKVAWRALALLQTELEAHRLLTAIDVKVSNYGRGCPHHSEGVLVDSKGQRLCWECGEILGQEDPPT